jgi:hypothetical protein
MSNLGACRYCTTPQLARLSGFGGNESPNPLIALEGAPQGLHYNDKAEVA